MIDKCGEGRKVALRVCGNGKAEGSSPSAPAIVATS